jgi:hypothetical protein
MPRDDIKRDLFSFGSFKGFLKTLRVFMNFWIVSEIFRSLRNFNYPVIVRPLILKKLRK